MNLKEIAEILDAEAVSGADLATVDIPNAYACDLMSDVLAFCPPGALLLTGLTNVQIVRTAQMLDLPAVVFVRGKKPLEETLALAKENGIPVLMTKLSLYETCGKLFAKGLEPGYAPTKEA
ncbi:transcriptional regulator [Synergistaceae bacterium OttesenSCG-928-D05]|nr:transcriptional regulator [Synergistaceae bacterium OttesenSCG-928-D05]